MSDDLFGGMYDFNGDGKTDLEEQFMAHEMLHEIAQAENKKKNDEPRAPRPVSSFPNKPLLFSVMNSTELPLPDEVTREEYQYRQSGFRKVCVLTVLISAVLCFLAGAVAWVGFSVYEPGNAASAIVSILFGFGGLFVFCLIVRAAGSLIAQEKQFLQKAKEAYLRYAAKESRQ